MELKQYDPKAVKHIRVPTEGEYFVFATCDEDGPLVLVLAEEIEPIDARRMTGYALTQEDMMKLDFRLRCKRCGKLPRGKMQTEHFKRYTPYCSYHCQEWANLKDAQRYINENFGHKRH